MNRKKNILIAVVGVSPAVLTETVWALAVTEGIVVDEVIAITTLHGKKAIEQLLFKNKGWQKLIDTLAEKKINVEEKLAFGSSDSIKVIGNGKQDFLDITTPEENNYTGNFILKVLRQYTENPNTNVIASIAGGRKTMSALMLACMSLLGRENDRVCHILINTPYDQQMSPPFLFPEKGVTHTHNGKKYHSLKARPQLSDISFIRIRGWYEQEYKKQPASYTHMVSLFRKKSPIAINYPEIKIDCASATVTITNNTAKLHGAYFALLYIYIRRIKQKVLPQSWNDILDEMDNLHDLHNVPDRYIWWHDFAEKEVDVNKFNRWADNTRKRLASISDKRISEALIPKLKGNNNSSYPPYKIKLTNDWISMDIRNNANKSDSAITATIKQGRTI